ncbi:MAG: alpha/beta hydrolase family protein, partial [Gemmatimonadaceae bacterium]
APDRVGRPAPVIMVLHGWPWCRMGTQAKHPINDLPGSRPVHLLPFMKQLHDEGYAVLAPDLRNFGDSEARGVISGGWLESRDVLGALDYLRTRQDVDMDRIGAIGFSQGGATLMFASAMTDQIKAAIAIQPTTPALFAKNYSHALMGPLAFIVSPIADVFYRLAGGPSLAFIRPALVAAGARFPILYVQGTGDRWGSQADVQQMAAMTPGSSAIYPETTHRFEGYTWVLQHPEVSMDFLRTHLRAPASAPPRALEPSRPDSAAGDAQRQRT